MKDWFNMSSKTTTYCDRCGTEITYDNMVVECTGKENVTYVIKKNTYHHSWWLGDKEFYDHLDLCSDCHADLCEFLEEKKK